MSTHKRDDGTVVDVEYCVEQHGHSGNGWDDAGEPTIIAIGEVYDANTGTVVELTDAEIERVEQEIAQAVDNDPMDEDLDR